MLTQTEARIYLSANRKCTQSDGMRSLHTFYEDEYGTNGEGFGKITGFSEETLLPGNRTILSVKSSVEVILVPVVGGLELVNGNGESIFVSSGETFRFLTFPEGGFSVVNPYDDETISYLQLLVRPGILEEKVKSDTNNTPLTTISFENENTLLPAFLTFGEKICGFLGQYDGRQEGEYNLRQRESGIFVFIIHGAFEVQNRLLEKGDALSLRHIEKLEFEALSNSAIILMGEVELR